MSKDVEEKDYVKEDRKRTISKVINIVLWVLLFAWMVLVFTDYLKVKNWNVLHIMTTSKAQEHKYTSPARIVDDCVFYSDEN